MARPGGPATGYRLALGLVGRDGVTRGGGETAAGARGHKSTGRTERRFGELEDSESVCLTRLGDDHLLF
jgi:hypothetical protein